MEKSLGKVFLPKAQRTRGQFCGTPSQVGASVVITDELRGQYVITATDAKPG